MSNRKTVTGKVISHAMDKTIRVQVESKRKHPRFKKYVSARTIYFAHDEKNEAKSGDLVQISFTRPLSKMKRWKLDQIVVVAN
ncbi:MAG: 30S ribosomal protein S17 [Planctomycetes bacterium]|nr:30S ribosomal protein S17 [Planctomycetota bacterium]